MATSTKPVDESANARGELARPVAGRLVTGRVVAGCWILQVALLVATLAWISLDGYFHTAADNVDAIVRSTFEGVFLFRSELGKRECYLLGIGVLALLACIGLVFGLAAGTSRQRRVIAWLGAMVVVASWLTLYLQWPSIAWQGQRWRLWSHLSDVDPLVTLLRESWPKVDGDMPLLGAFMSYPRYDPRTLLVMGPPEVNPEVRVIGVERSPAGAIRFELGEAEYGTWLEWHPKGSTPASFRGGLEGDYLLLKSSKIEDDWYITHYRDRNVRNL